MKNLAANVFMDANDTRLPTPSPMVVISMVLDDGEMPANAACLHVAAGYTDIGDNLMPLSQAIMRVASHHLGDQPFEMAVFKLPFVAMYPLVRTWKYLGKTADEIASNLEIQLATLSTSPAAASKN